MKTLLFICFLLTAFADTESKHASDFTCILASDKTLYKVGELPTLSVEIFNNTKHDVYLIGSLDASDVQWRYPYCYYSIEGPVLDTCCWVLRCGNMNTLRVSDFRLIKSGKKFNPYERVDAYGFFGDYKTLNKKTFQTPGIYKLKFYYSTNSKKFSDFLGDRPFKFGRVDSIKIADLLRKVPRIDLMSNEIEIKIEE